MAIRVGAAFVRAVAGLCGCIQLLAVHCQDLDSSIALLQGAMHIHDLVEAGPTAKQFLVDNSHLKHKGPGILWRSSKELSSILGKNQYAAWGSVVQGHESGDGWIKVGALYLPTRINNVLVITHRGNDPDRTRLRISYRPTAVKVQDGTWIDCTIIGQGRKPDTFDIHVTPPDFTSYNVTNVPASMLKKVQRVREFVTLPPPRVELKHTVPSNMSVMYRAPMAADVKGFIELDVRTPQGDSVWLKILKKSPLRTLMKMACERVDLTWESCQRKMRFLHKGVKLVESDHAYEMGMVNGATIEMQKA